MSFCVITKYHIVDIVIFFFIITFKPLHFVLKFLIIILVHVCGCETNKQLCLIMRSFRLKSNITLLKG